MYKKM